MLFLLKGSLCIDLFNTLCKKCIKFDPIKGRGGRPPPPPSYAPDYTLLSFISVMQGLVLVSFNAFFVCPDALSEMPLLLVDPRQR